MVVDNSSSSFSVESSFRELDDVFLQSQARIWLGEVLHTRYDEQLDISELLSDGELLFEVSRVLWNMLLVKYMEFSNVKAHMFIPVDTRKSSGRYRPYSNVDSFLKVCKVLGLNGVDLFSPSDVVEKRDTRKVCICIRSLSKKARSKRLNVPDFDIVTKTIAMPTDAVGCIRRSLELSTCHVGRCQDKDARLRFRQESTSAAHRPKDDSLLDESDDANTDLSDKQSSNSSTDTLYTNDLYLESTESEEVNNYALTEGILYSDTLNQDKHRVVHISGSAESILLQYVRNDSQLDSISSPVNESRLMICDEVTPVDHGANFWRDNGDYGMGENAPGLRNFLEDSRTDVNHNSHQLSLSDMVSIKVTNDPFPISKDCLCHSCMSSGSHNSNTTPKTSMYKVWRMFPDDVEASPTSSMTSIVGRVLDFDFDAKSAVNNESQDMVSYVPLDKSVQYQFETKLENFDLSVQSFCPFWGDPQSSSSSDQNFESLDNQISSTRKEPRDRLLLVKSNITEVTGNAQETVVRKGENDNLILDVQMVDSESKLDPQRLTLQEVDRKGFDYVDKEGDKLCTNQSYDVHCTAQDGNESAFKDEKKDNDVDFWGEENLDERSHKGTSNMQKKPTYIAPLLKTVAKGTALVGILFLLHLRKRSEIFTKGEATEASSQIRRKSNGVRFTTMKGEKGSKIYPVEKFKFGIR